VTGRTNVRPSAPEGFRAIDGRFSRAGRPRHPEPPLFAAQPLKAQIAGAASGPIYEGSQLFLNQGRENCHSTPRQGGHVLDVTTIADRLRSERITVRILNGGTNVYAFGAILMSQEVDFLLTCSKSRNTSKIILGAREPARK